MRRDPFLVMLGPSNAGKTTTARALSAGLGYRHVSFDPIFRKRLQRHGLPGFSLMGAVRDTVTLGVEAWRSRVPVVLEGLPFMLNRPLDLLLQAAIHNGIPARFVALDHPLHVLFRRMRGRMAGRRKQGLRLSLEGMALLVGSYVYFKKQQLSMSARIRVHGYPVSILTDPGDITLSLAQATT